MRKNLKKYAAFMITLAVGLFFTGCGKSESEDTTNKTVADEESAAVGSDMYVGLLVPTLSDDFHINFSDRMTEWLEAEGIPYELASFEMETTEMVVQMENMAAMGITDFYTNPFDQEAAQDALKKLKDEGIRNALGGGTGISPDVFDFNMDINQYDCGDQVAKLAAEWIDETFPDAEDGSVEVITIVNTTGDTPITQRGEGLSNVEQYTSKAKIVETYDLVGEVNTGAKTQEYVDGAFISHPNLKVVLTVSGTDSLAANEAVMRISGINYSEFAVFSGDFFDAMAAVIEQSADNKSVLRGSVGFEDLADAYIKYLNGKIDESEIAEDKTYYLGLLPVTAENLSEYYAG